MIDIDELRQNDRWDLILEEVEGYGPIDLILLCSAGVDTAEEWIALGSSCNGYAWWFVEARFAPNVVGARVKLTWNNSGIYDLLDDIPGRHLSRLGVFGRPFPKTSKEKSTVGE